jgi:glycosyltransferase involved in cell wall biosynthesis
MPAADVYVLCNSDVVHGHGGARTRAAGLADALAARGVRTLVIGVERGQTTGDAADDRFRNLVVPGAGRLWRWQNLTAATRLRAALRTLPPPRCAIVAIAPHWVVASQPLWPHLPVFYAVPCVLSNCLPFTAAGGRPAGISATIDRAALRRLERRAFRTATMSLVAAHACRDEVVAFCPPAAGRVQVVPYLTPPQDRCAATRAAQRQKLDLGDDHFLVLSAGVCDENKDPATAVRAIAAANGAVHLAVVGDGPQHARCAALAAQLGIGDRVHFAGSQADIIPWLAASDAVVSTSHYDMFPNAVQEALAVGLPVVVPRHDPPRVYAGIAPLVEHTACGLLFDRDDPRALAAALDRLAADRDRAAALGARGRALAERTNGYDAVAQAFSEVINATAAGLKDSRTCLVS